ncbi:PIN domain-containing protein [Streptomyces sp. NPDC055912]|uniref:PIN domain-containing protein n=1 Tax=Streptomyces sp. NPDC055912 TaxID=3345660 RepID=UPI0035DC2095
MTSSFLSSFSGMWRRPGEDYEVGVSEYLVIIDTNVLLELYRFTPDARNELLNVLTRLGDRLWVPHQVGKEYYERRVDAIKEHLDLYSSVPKKLEEAKGRAIQEVSAFARRCSLSAEERAHLIEPIEAAFKGAIENIKKRESEFDLDLAKVVTGDPILESLASILDGKVGSPFDESDSVKFMEEFKERVEKKIPPGFEDAQKPENPHGDFFVWEQLLQEAQRRKVSVLLVTNDEKKDWVRKQAGLTVGPRPELLREFEQRCDTDFLLANLGLFLKVAKEKLDVSVSASTVAQAESTDRRIKVTDEEIYSLSSAELDTALEAVYSRLDGLTSIIHDPEIPTRLVAEAKEERAFAEEVLGALRDSSEAYWDETEGQNFHVILGPHQWRYISDESHKVRRRDKERTARRSRARTSELQRELEQVQGQLRSVASYRNHLAVRLDAEGKEGRLGKKQIESEVEATDQAIADLQFQAAKIRDQLSAVHESGEPGSDSQNAG